MYCISELSSEMKSTTSGLSIDGSRSKQMRLMIEPSTAEGNGTLQSSTLIHVSLTFSGMALLAVMMVLISRRLVLALPAATCHTIALL